MLQANASYLRVALAEDSQPKAEIKVMGCNLLRKFPGVQYVMVFPHKGAGVDATEFLKSVPTAVATWKAAFPHSKLPATVSDGMSKEAFINAVVAEVKNVLEGIGCDMDEDRSVDDDETYLGIQVRDAETLDIMAELIEARARVKPEAYGSKECPTTIKQAPSSQSKDQTMFRRYVEDNDRDKHLNGDLIDNACPAFVRFSRDTKDKLEDFTVPDKLRIVRRAIARNIHLPALEEADVLRVFFAAHDWEFVQELYDRGWSDPRRLFMWPRHTMPDYLANYFGVQVAYFFHFYNTFIKWLTAPAICSVVVLALRFSGMLSSHKIHVMDTIFGLGLCLWTTAFLASYNKNVQFKTLKWGMNGASLESAAVRKQFQDKLRGTAWETFEQVFHWLLCALFICETIGMIAFLNAKRSAAHQDKDGVTFGLPNEVAVDAFKYLITINIKVVDKVWMWLSPLLSNRENWRTDVELKSAMGLKLFAVKFIIFYYPFFYTLFIQPYGVGCPGGEIRGCLNLARSDLAMFFVTQVISECVEVVIMLASVYWDISTQLSNKMKLSGTPAAGKSNYLSYLEYQALCAPYTVSDEVGDYIDVVFNFGFIAMFGVTTPSICILCFMAAFPLKRLAGYKFCFAHQRVIPRAQEGIGSWSSVMTFLAYMGVTVTCYIVIFLYNIWDLSFRQNLVLFVITERALVGFKFAIEAFFGDKSVQHKRIDEHNDDVLDQVLGKARETEPVRRGTLRASTRALP